MLIFFKIFFKRLPAVHPVAFFVLRHAVDIYSLCILVISRAGAVNLIIARIRPRERAVMHERYRLAVGALYHSSNYIALVEFIVCKVVIFALGVLEPGVESARLACH